MRGTPGATIELARGVKKVIVAMTPILNHFCFLVQLMGRSGSSVDSQSTTFGSCDIVSVTGTFSSASCVVSMTGIPCSTLGSSFSDRSIEDFSDDWGRRACGGDGVAIFLKGFVFAEDGSIVFGRHGRSCTSTW